MEVLQDGGVMCPNIIVNIVYCGRSIYDFMMGCCQFLRKREQDRWGWPQAQFTLLYVNLHRALQAGTGIAAATLRPQSQTQCLQDGESENVMLKCGG